MGDSALATGHGQAPTLKITEIFFSIQGESNSVGAPTTFVRLTGCPLRCSYCDTAYAFTGGERMSVDAILEQVSANPSRIVTVTGGEPLAQQNCLALLRRLCDEGYTVSLETSGALSLEGVDERVSIVMDIKTPASGEMAKNRLANIDALGRHDQIKFVLADRADFDWAVALVRENDLCGRSEVFFSPVYGQLEARDLAEWILAEGLPVRLQIQLHKVLWGDVPGV